MFGRFTTLCMKGLMVRSGFSSSSTRTCKTTNLQTFQFSGRTFNPFNAWWPLKGHTYLNKPVVKNFFSKCDQISMIGYDSSLWFVFNIKQILTNYPLFSLKPQVFWWFQEKIRLILEVKFENHPLLLALKSHFSLHWD